MKDYNKQLSVLSDISIFPKLSDNMSPIEIIGRSILMPQDYKNIVVSMDNNSQILTFKINRYFDEADFYSKTIAIKFKNALGEADQSFAVNIKIVDTDKLQFGWILDSRVARQDGNVSFAIEISDDDSTSTDMTDIEYPKYVWQTVPAILRVEKGLLVDGVVPEPDASWLRSFFIIMKEKENKLEQISEKVQEQADKIPYIGEDGYWYYWSNLI